MGDPADVTRIVDFAERRFGGIDHLVNNAAIIKVAPMAKLTLVD